MWWEPTHKALIVDLWPDDHRATMSGFYYLVRDVIVSVAAMLGAVLWIWSPTSNLLVASAFGLAGTVWFARQALGDTNATPALRR